MVYLRLGYRHCKFLGFEFHCLLAFLRGENVETSEDWFRDLNCYFFSNEVINFVLCYRVVGLYAGFYLNGEDYNYLDVLESYFEEIGGNLGCPEFVGVRTCFSEGETEYTALVDVLHNFLLVTLLGERVLLDDLSSI